MITYVKKRKKKVKVRKRRFDFPEASTQKPFVRTEPSTVDEYKLLASICRDSFWEFAKEFWHIVVPETPIWNWHMEELCNAMQEVAERVFKGLPKLYDSIYNVPPGTSKSTICSILFSIWVWTRMPTARCLCGSFAYPLALDLSRKARDLVKSELFQKCFPEIKLREDQDTKAYFANTLGGYRYAFGVNGSVTGMHGHFIIVDDPLDPNRSMSDLELKSTNHWMRETLSQRKVDKLVTAEILIMQRLHQNDPTGDRLSNKKAPPVRHYCLPAKLSEHVKPVELRSKYTNGYLDPVRLPEAVLQNAAGTLGEYGYACQFDQNPIPRGGGMFKIDRISILPFAPPKLKKIVRYWDKAGSAGKGAFTVGCKMAIDFEPGNIHYVPRIIVLGIVRGQWESRKREKTIKETAIADTRLCHIGVEQEPGSSGKEAAEGTIRNLMGFSTIADKVSGDKVDRADPFSVQVNAGNVYLVEGDWNADYLAELQFFPYSKYKDQVDASSGAFNMLMAKIFRAGAL